MNLMRGHFDIELLHKITMPLSCIYDIIVEDGIQYSIFLSTFSSSLSIPIDNNSDCIEANNLIIPS